MQNTVNIKDNESSQDSLEHLMEQYRLLSEKYDRLIGRAEELYEHIQLLNKDYNKKISDTW